MVFGDINRDGQFIDIADRQCRSAGLDKFTGLDVAREHHSAHGRIYRQLGDLRIDQGEACLCLSKRGLRLIQRLRGGDHSRRLRSSLQGQQAGIGGIVTLLGNEDLSAGVFDIIRFIAVHQVVVGFFGIIKVGKDIVVIILSGFVQAAAIRSIGSLILDLLSDDKGGARFGKVLFGLEIIRILQVRDDLIEIGKRIVDGGLRGIEFNLSRSDLLVLFDVPIGLVKFAGSSFLPIFGALCGLRGESSLQSLVIFGLGRG